MTDEMDAARSVDEQTRVLEGARLAHQEDRRGLSRREKGGGPPPLQSVVAIDQEEVRRAYENSRETVISIRNRFGLTKRQLDQMRIAGGWTARSQISAPGALRGRKALGEEELARRLNRLLTFGIAILEKQVVREGMTEAHACTLRELCRAQEARVRTTKNRNAARDREKKNKDDGRDFRDDSAWLDAELNRRLERLRAARTRDRKSALAGRECGGEAGVPGELAEERGAAAASA